MLVAPTIDYVSRTATRKPKPIYGREIAARRAQLGKSGTDIEMETDGLIYTKLLSRIETGRKDPREIPAMQLNALLAVLDWTYTDFESHTHLKLDRFSVSSTPAAEVFAREVAYPKGMKPIALMRTLSAGPGGDDGEIIGHVGIPTDWEGEYCAYEVDGSSMEPDIPHGSIVIARMQTHAELGQTVVAYCDDRGMVVKELKITNEAQRKAIFSSKNPKYAPILIGEGCRILGKVVEVRRRLN